MSSLALVDPWADLPLVVVTVGTDYHPFDRLVGWADRWCASQDGAVRALAQVGTSAPPDSLEWRRYLSGDELTAAMDAASAVVCHGGPSTIMGARAAGHLPVVVPRLRRNGEHVDDHQVRFTRWMAERGDIALARSESELHQLLDRALRHPEAFLVDGAADEAAASVQRFGELVDALLGGNGS